MNKKDQQIQIDKWEKILKSYGLGVCQPLTDNLEGDFADILPMSDIDIKNHSAEDFKQLRKGIDSDDPFMEGHQITKVRQRTREIPEWSGSNQEVQKLLLKVFPRLTISNSQRKRAARWARFIYLYYRMRLSSPMVMKEMSLTRPMLEALVRSMNRVASGLTTDKGKPRRDAGSQTPIEGSTKERGNEPIESPPLHITGDGGAGAGGAASS